MRRDQNRLKTAMTRQRVVVSVVSLGVLAGVMGLETGASAYSTSHVLSHVRQGVELRRLVPATSIPAKTAATPATAPAVADSTATTSTPGLSAFNTSHLQSPGHVGAELRRYVPSMTVARKVPATPILAVPTTVVPASTVPLPASGAKTTSTGPGAATTTAPAPTTTTTTTTTTTPPAVTTSNGTVPSAPASLNAPTTMVFDDEFNTGSLNTSVWTPYWFSNGNQTNQTTMESSNVSVGGSGLALNLTAASTGGIVSTNPDDHAPGHTGFQVAPTAGHPVYVQWQATLPAATNGEIANWPAVWLTGQNWPVTGEIDVMEGLSGSAAFHYIWGTASGVANPASEDANGNVNTQPGTHTYGVMWTTSSLTYVYDGQVVGTITANVTDAPMYLVMENSLAPSIRPTPALLNTTMTVRYARVWQS
jgi:hypothetical protein